MKKSLKIIEQAGPSPGRNSKMLSRKVLCILIGFILITGFNTLPADTLIPLNSGMQMTCQFVNNTGGQYSNSQIYVLCYGQNSSSQMCCLDQNGNMVPLAAGQNLSSFSYPLSSFSGFQFPPAMISCRLYVSLGSPLSMNINPGTPVGVAAPNINNPTDPNINTVFDWIEFNLQNSTIFCNTTQVDMFGIPMVMTLYDNASGGGYTVNGTVGITETASAIMSEFVAGVPSQFQNLETPVRIVAPVHGSFGSGGANATYLFSYIAGVWSEYTTTPCVIQMGGKTYTGTVNAGNQLAFTTPGDSNTYLVNYPSDQDVWGGAGTMAETTDPGNGQITSVELALEAIICASFHRHVMDNTTNINNPSAYYQAAPYDYYAQFWHIHSINGMAYGFCYDDVNTQSSTMVSTNPRGIILGIGGGTYTASTATPTPVPQSTWRVNAGGPQYIDTQGNTWAADEDFSGGTQAAASINTITGALPGAADQVLYQTQRYGNPFTYTFNVPAGSYQVTMKFAETYWTAAGQRIFNVSINGSQVLSNFDIFKDAGGENIADDKVYSNISPNTSGQIVIQFGPAGVDNAMVNAIRIIPMPSTPTLTYTAMPTLTNTPTNTATNTGTLTITATRTNTFTVTPSLTATSTVTRTFTPTITLTPTGINTGTFTPAYTRTNTTTATLTNTETNTLLPTLTITSLNTPTNTPTYKPSASATWRVVSATSTETATTNASATCTVTESATLTETSTNTPAGTPTESSTFNVQSSMTNTPTETPSAMLTAINIIGTITQTPTPATTGVLTIGPVKPYPNPINPLITPYLKIAVNITPNDIDSITLKIYTVSYRLIKEETFEETDAQEIASSGILEYSSSNLTGLSEGIYYFVVIVKKGGETAASKIDAIIILK